jgi:dihydroflavonol-4-reductase
VHDPLLEGDSVIDPETPLRVVVLGGSGFLGLATVNALIDAGNTPRCGRRARSNVLGLRALKVPLVHADLDDPASLRPALAGAEVVVHVAGHYPRLSLDPCATIALATRQMHTLLDAVAEAGARRLVYLSSTATVAPRHDGAPSTEVDRYAAAPGFGTYHDVKWHLEALAEQERRFEVVTVCPGACIGAHDYKLGTAAFLAATARGLQPPHPAGLVNVVDVRDVGLAAARAVTLETPPKRVLLSGGTYELHALLESLAPRYGAPAPVAPLDAAAAIALADEAEHQAVATKSRPTLSRELVDLVVHAVPVDASRSRDVLGLTYRPLSQTLDSFDEWARKIGLLPNTLAPVVSTFPPTTQRIS